MRKKTLVLIIVAASIIVLGILTCVVASIMANVNNIQLFEDQLDNDGNIIAERSFSSSTVSKITLELHDANVHVYGNASESKIVFKNYPLNSYELITENRNLSFKDSIGILSFFDVSKTGISFNGFRQYINVKSYSNLKKEIYIYVSPEDGIKKYNINLSNGNVYVEGFSFDTDFSIIQGKGNLEINSLVLSGVNAKIQQGNITVNGATVNGVLSMSTNDGNINILTNYVENRGYQLNSENGSVTVYDTNYGLSFVFNPIYSTNTSYKLNTKNGNINVGISTLLVE